MVTLHISSMTSSFDRILLGLQHDGGMVGLFYGVLKPGILRIVTPNKVSIKIEPSISSSPMSPEFI